jgi:hypothetical protein
MTKKHRHFPEEVKRAAVKRMGSTATFMTTATLSGFLLSHPRGAPQRDFLHFLHSHPDQSRVPAGGNNQAPKPGVWRFDHQQLREEHPDGHNKKERQEATSRKIAGLPALLSWLARWAGRTLVREPERELGSIRFRIGSLPNVRARSLRLRVNLVESSAFSCPLFRAVRTKRSQPRIMRVTFRPRPPAPEGVEKSQTV